MKPPHEGMHPISQQHANQELGMITRGRLSGQRGSGTGAPTLSVRVGSDPNRFSNWEQDGI